MNWLLKPLVLASLLLAVLSPVSGAQTVGVTGARVTVIPIATNLTTNTTSAVVEVPNGPKSVTGIVECTSGACTQTQAIYGTNYPTAVNGILLCTITLTATTRDDDACPVITAAFSRYYVVTTNTSGTAATGAVYVAY
jgi:hypothetical protein